MTRALRFIRWTSLGVIVLLAIAVAVLHFRPGAGPAAENALAGGVSIGGPFHLTDERGHAVTAADYRGRWMLVYFGYTDCPDDCPLTLQKMAVALRTLGPLADKVAPLFITVDPARDTPARLAELPGELRSSDRRPDRKQCADCGGGEGVPGLLLAGRAREIGRRHRRPLDVRLSDEPGRQVRRAAAVGRRCRHAGGDLARQAAAFARVIPPRARPTLHPPPHPLPSPA